MTKVDVSIEDDGEGDYYGTAGIEAIKFECEWHMEGERVKIEDMTQDGLPVNYHEDDPLMDQIIDAITGKVAAVQLRAELDWELAQERYEEEHDTVSRGVAKDEAVGSAIDAMAELKE